MQINWTYIQGSSALSFGTFTAFHLANSAAGILGPERYNALQQIGRLFYQSQVGETILLGSLGAHLVASTARILQRQKTQQQVKATQKQKLHRYAGYVMTAVIAGHIYACRFQHGFGPEFEGLSFSTRHKLGRWTLLPYLSAFGTAGSIHMVMGLPSACGFAGFPKVAKFLREKVPLQVVTACFVVGVQLGLLGFLGAFQNLPSFAEHPYSIKFAEEFNWGS